VKKLTLAQTELSTWFERDRSHVDLKRKDTGETIIEWWDEAVTQAVEDGFLDPRDYHGSAFEYADTMGLLTGNKAGVSIHAIEDDDEDDDDDFDDDDDDDDEEFFP
jgi:hypothetical protein